MTQETQPEHPDPTEPQEDAAGSEQSSGADDGPDPSELDEDPAYEPDGPLKDLKGG
jgi:hypothetical protein